MTKERRVGQGWRLRRVSRREMIKLVAGGILAGCNPVRQAVVNESAQELAQAPTAVPTLTATSVQTETPTRAPTATVSVTPTATATAIATAAEADTPSPAVVPTATVMPTATAAATATSTQMPTTTAVSAATKAPGAGASKVAVTRHGGAWAEHVLVPNVLEQMIDAAVMALTGYADAAAAWASLFAPHERIAIKVNTIMATAETSVPLVMAVAERLQAVGIPAGQIVIFDRSTNELNYAGYPVNQDGPGVCCYGTDGNYASGWSISGVDIKLSNILLDCDALINMPVLKQHGYTGISMALKNHYGTFDKPARFHAGIDSAMPELNALPPIQERTRLIVGDMLKIMLGDGWTRRVLGDAIVMSSDPVALDAVSLIEFAKVIETDGKNSASAVKRASSWLANAADLGLGVGDMDRIDLSEIDLG
ncbi:MAG: DUF362 domain-containing protein [Anaerolineae bacterium]|nr:DUF362 domain-containing protein [Anaerolineae bacterium]